LIGWLVGSFVRWLVSYLEMFSKQEWMSCCHFW